MKRSRENDDDDDSASPFFRQLKSWRTTELNTLFRLNKSVWASCQTANQIECMTIKTEQEIARCNELYATEHGTVLVFGDNDNNLLGLPMPEEDQDTTTPTALPHVTQVRAVSLGGLHAAALTVNGDVYAWGVADNGALGYMPPPVPEGSTPEEVLPKIVPKLNDILQVKCGDSQTLFLNTQGQVLMCGMIRASNDDQYHYPSPETSCEGSSATPVPIPMPGNLKAIRIEAGNASNFAAALLEDGSLVTFGKSGILESLLDSFISHSLLFSHAYYYHYYDDSGFGEKGELARSRDIVAPLLDGGFDVTAAFLEMTVPEVLQRFLTPHKARFAGPVPFPYSRKKVLSFACGSNHLLVLARNVGEGITTLYSSGQNSSGQLGLPQEIPEVHELTEVRPHVSLVAAGPYHSYMVDGDGHKMFACGQNSYAQLGLGHSRSPQFGWQAVAFPEPVLLTKITSGGSHGMAVDADNTLYTWGFGTMGATGHAHAADGEEGGDILRPTRLNLKSNKKILDCGGGGQHSVVLLSEKDHEEG